MAGGGYGHGHAIPHTLAMVNIPHQVFLPHYGLHAVATLILPVILCLAHARPVSQAVATVLWTTRRHSCGPSKTSVRLGKKNRHSESGKDRGTQRQEIWCLSSLDPPSTMMLPHLTMVPYWICKGYGMG